MKGKICIFYTPSHEPISSLRESDMPARERIGGALMCGAIRINDFSFITLFLHARENLEPVCYLNAK